MIYNFRSWVLLAMRKCVQRVGIVLRIDIAFFHHPITSFQHLAADDHILERSIFTYGGSVGITNCIVCT